MKTPDNNGRRELLADLFPDGAPGAPISADEVVRWVEAERRCRARRRMRWTSVGLLLAVMGAVWALLPARMERESKAKVVAAEPAPEEKDTTSTTVSGPPEVERINDDELLGMIDDAPAALVQWPDGRRSLLVVVGSGKALKR